MEPLYKCGIWIAEKAIGEDECYSPGEIFIKANYGESFKVPLFLGKADIPEGDNLLKLIDIVSQAMVKGLALEREDGRVYLVALGESQKMGIHFRLLPRYRADQGFLNELDPDVNEQNDGLALMAHWRKQFLHKKKKDGNEIKDLRERHEKAIDKVREALQSLNPRSFP